jgi:hypothetical protein
MNTIQLIQINHNELISLISEAIKKEFQNFKPSINESSKKEDEYLTRKSASRFLNVSLTTINQWQKQGIITRYKLGNKNFYKKSELEATINASNITKSNL